MGFDGITEFVAVADCLSFTKAAKELNVSAAHVSRKIHFLESKLKVKLFYRSTRKVSLTTEGSLFYKHASQLVTNLENAENEIFNLNNTPKGLIKITAPVTLGEEYILPMLNNFIKENFDMQSKAYLTNNNIDIISEGYDLAIRIGKLPDSNLIAIKIGSRANYVCASPNYLKKFGHPVHFQDIKKHQCLQSNVNLNYWLFYENRQEQKVKLHSHIIYNSGKAILDAAIKGLGLCRLPSYYLNEYIHKHKLIRVLKQYETPSETIWALYPNRTNLPIKVSKFVSYLKVNFKQLDVITQ